MAYESYNDFRQANIIRKLMADNAQLKEERDKAERNVTYADKAAEVYERQRDELLVACQKQEELHKHEVGCWTCPYHCKAGSQLRQEAEQLRQAAIAKAKDESR